MPVIIKKLDRQGRIVVPKEWRDRNPGDRVLLSLGDSRIVLTPVDEVDLTEYFDSLEVDIESDLSDWNGVRRELW